MWRVLALVAVLGCSSDDRCGGMNQPCCATHQCNDSALGCMYTAANPTGMCIPCGQPTAPCCTDDPKCSGMDVQCRGTDPPVCVALGPCGQAQERCCDMAPQCASGLTCKVNPGGMPTPWCN
jgi:hypothetical protein